MAAWALLALGVLLPLAGCSCEPYPFLGVTADGAPAIGWRTDGTEVVRGARLVEADGTAVWEIAGDGAPPMVIAVGEPIKGFDTVVPLEGPLDMSGRVLWVLYDRGGVAVDDAYWSFLDYRYEPSTQMAGVDDAECGEGGFLGLPWRQMNVLRRLTLVVAVIVAVSLLVLIGVTMTHVAHGRRARSTER